MRTDLKSGLEPLPLALRVYVCIIIASYIVFWWLPEQRFSLECICDWGLIFVAEQNQGTISSASSNNRLGLIRLGSKSSLAIRHPL